MAGKHLGREICVGNILFDKTSKLLGKLPALFLDEFAAVGIPVGGSRRVVILVHLALTLEQASDNSTQISERERFRDIGVGTRLQAVDLVVGAVSGRENHYRHIVKMAVAADGRRKLQAVGSGHHDIGDNKIRRL